MKTIKSPYAFRGGIHPEYHKDLTEAKAVIEAPLAKVLYVSMSQHLGAPAMPKVAVGDKVLRYQLLGEKQGAVSCHVYSPVAGTVKEIANRIGPAGSYAKAIVIEVDETNPLEGAAPFAPLEWRTAEPAELLKRVEAAGLCGMGGAGFPTALKLSPPPDKNCDFIILNGAECEPYLTADAHLMEDAADKIRTGVEIMRRILTKVARVPAVRIAVEENKPRAIAALEKAFADIEGDVQIVVLPVKYPQGSEKHQIYAVTGRKVPDGALPISVGCIVENVSTVASIADAVEKGIPPTTRITTVTGDGVKNPCNVRAVIGTRYEELVALAGGLVDNVAKIISGGPMMGFTVANLDIATTKTTSGILLLTDKSVFQYSSNACINCGRCLRSCPMGCNPAEIARSMEANDAQSALKFGVMNCIECGACTFMCPAYRNLTQFCRRAKMTIRAAAAKAKADAQAAAAKQANK